MTRGKAGTPRAVERVTAHGYGRGRGPARLRALARDTICCVLGIGYALSTRFPDPPQTDYRRADVHALRHDLFCGDVYLADTKADRELPTAWGWVPVLDFAWALCDIVEHVDRDPAGSRAARPQQAEPDFTESTDRLLFERRFGRVDIEAEWLPACEPSLSFSHTELRREARDFLHDLLADLTDLHDDLADIPATCTLQARFPRVAWRP